MFSSYLLLKDKQLASYLNKEGNARTYDTILSSSIDHGSLGDTVFGTNEFSMAWDRQNACYWPCVSSSVYGNSMEVLRLQLKPS
jgi:hypothetical protein